MIKTSGIAIGLILALSAWGCAEMRNSDSAIMRATPGDPVGSANIGTGSVTTGSTIPLEAKAAGIGLGP